MTPTQKLMARHALGLPNDKRRSYRNYYTAPLGSATEAAWDGLVSMGFAHRGEKPSTLARYCMTYKGARAVLYPGETLDTEDFPEAGS